MIYTLLLKKGLKTLAKAEAEFSQVEAVDSGMKWYNATSKYWNDNKINHKFFLIDDATGKEVIKITTRYR